MSTLYRRLQRIEEGNGHACPECARYPDGSLGPQFPPGVKVEIGEAGLHREPEYCSTCGLELLTIRVGGAA